MNSTSSLQAKQRFSESASVTAINDAEVIRFRMTVRNPVTVESLPFLGRLFRIGFRCRKGLSKRLIGRPSRKLFRFLSRTGFPSTGQLRIETPDGPRRVTFDARNTQFCTLYSPQFAPFYEAELCTIFDRLIGPRDVFFDIGANWGWHSLMIGNRPSFQGRVHSFEPFPPTFRDLAGIVKGAGLESHVTCHNIALADKDGDAKMSIDDGMQSGGAHLGEDGVRVQMRKLDSLDLPLPKVMKVDVEGHELEVLQGAVGLINKARPFIVFENWLQRDRPEATFAPMAHLIEAGYRLFYPGWVIGHPDCIVSSYAGTNDLALVPFLLAQRSQLGDLVNVVAVPAERMDEFRACFDAASNDND